MYSKQFEEEFILLSDSGLIKDSLFCKFSVTVPILNNFLEPSSQRTQSKYKAEEKKKSDVGMTTKDNL